MATQNNPKHDSKHYEDLIRRMKVLSVSQSAFLKSFVHSKLSSGVSLVQRSIDLLSAKTSNNDQKIAELKTLLINLKLNEIDVDVSSSQLMLQDELTQLRKSVEYGVAEILGDNGNAKLPPPPGGPAKSSNSEDKEAIRALEAQNNELRSLLRDAQNEITTMSKSKQSDNSSENSANRDLKAKVTKLELRISELESEVASKSSLLTATQTELKQALVSAEQAVADKSSSSSTLSEQLSQSRIQISALESQLAAAIKDGETKLNAKVKELNDKAANQVKEITAKLEGEKEVMMDAMTQEVEAIEASKAEAESQFKSQIKTLEASVDSLRNSKQKLASAMIKVQQSSKTLKSSVVTTNKDIKQELSDFKQSLSNLMTTGLVKKIKTLGDQYNDLNIKYKRELSERKRLHNVIQELKGNIRVFMRCRPPTASEISQFGSENFCVTFPNPGEVKVVNEKMREKSWEFDEVFDVNSTQEQVYKDVSDLVISVLDGYNVCIFAYGQTGSGKTWTMSGPPDNRGVNFRALSDLFAKTQARSKDFRDTISLSILEVYNEEIHDLMVEPSAQEKLDIRQGEFGNYVPGLTTVPVSNLDQVIEQMGVADRFRSQTATNMNEHSSRSHMMMTVTVVSENLITGVTSRGKLNLVDLAGSERINKSGATGQALKEAQNINKSLSALGDVIAARAAKQNHVPFRNSTLTYLLQDSLSQDSKTLMIVCASPMLFNSEETYCSLNFAARVRTVELGKASKNLDSGSSSKSSASLGDDKSGRVSPSIGTGGIASNPRSSIGGSSKLKTGTR